MNTNPNIEEEESGYINGHLVKDHRRFCELVNILSADFVVHDVLLHLMDHDDMKLLIDLMEQRLPESSN